MSLALRKPDLLCLAVVHVFLLFMDVVAVIKDVHWKRPGELRRGPLAWGRFFLTHGLLLLLLFQLIGTTDLPSDWNWRPLHSVFDVLLVSYLALFNGWFRNWIMGRYNRMEKRPE